MRTLLIYDHFLIPPSFVFSPGFQCCCDLHMLVIDFINGGNTLDSHSMIMKSDILFADDSPETKNWSLKHFSASIDGVLFGIRDSLWWWNLVKINSYKSGSMQNMTYTTRHVCHLTSFNVQIKNISHVSSGGFCINTISVLGIRNIFMSHRHYSLHSFKLTSFWLMYKVRFAGGRVLRQLQLMDRSSPRKYLQIKDKYLMMKLITNLCWAPSTLGPSWGVTTTSMSPYSLSVAKIGPSSLTSHLYLPVVSRLSGDRVT